MEIIKMPIGDIKPYPNNPRKNDDAVAAVMESIKQCGYCAPIVVDEDGVDRWEKFTGQTAVLLSD